MNNGLFIALFDIGGPEMMLILVVVLLLFGAKRLPEMMRNLGRSVEEFKRAANSVRHEVMNADLESGSNDRPPTPELPPASTTATTEPASQHDIAQSPVTESGEPVTPVEVAPENGASKAEFTMNVAAQPPAGTVSHGESNDQKPAQTA